MGVFSFLQNEINGAGNAIANGVSNTYHAAVGNIGNYISKEVAPPVSDFAGSVGRALLANPILGAQTAGTGNEVYNQPSPLPSNPRQYTQQSLQGFISQGKNNFATQAGGFVGNALPYFIGSGASAIGAKIGAQVGTAAGNYSSGSGIQNNLGNLSKDVGESFVNNLPGLPTGGITGKIANPLLRYGANAGIAGLENVGRAQGNSLIETGRPDTSVSNNLLNFGVGAGIHTILHPPEAFLASRSARDSAIGQLRMTDAAKKVGVNAPDRFTQAVSSPQQPGQEYMVRQGTEYPTLNLPNNQVEQFIRTGKIPQVNDYSAIPSAHQGTTEFKFDHQGNLLSINSDNAKFENYLKGFNTSKPGFINLGSTNKPIPSEETQAAMDNFNRQGALKDQNLPLKDIATESVRQKNALINQIRSYGKVVNNVVRSLSPADSQNLAHALEHPSEVAALTSQADNPKLFAKAVDTTQTQLAKAENARQQSPATNIGHITNYFPHELTSSATPEEQVAALEKMGFSSSEAQNYVANSSKTRLIPDIRTAESLKGENGQQLFTQNPDSAAVLRKYFSSQALEAGNSALTNTLGYQAPEHVNTGGQLLTGPDGKPMQSLNAPGLGGTAVSQELHQHLQGLEPSIFKDNKTVQTLDKAGGILKSIKLGLGGFHTLTTSLNDVVPEIMQGRYTALPKMMASIVSDSYNNASVERYVNNGTSDWLAKSGGTTQKGPDGLGETLGAKIGKLNPIENFTSRVFRGIDQIKYSLAEHYMNQGIDPTSTQGRQIGDTINNLFGGIDKQVLNRNQSVQQLLRVASISPDFTEGKIRSAATAFNLTRWDAGANLARTSVIGKVILSAILAETANRLTTGKWDSNVVTFLKQRVLDPQFSLPSQFQKPGGTNPVVAHLPSNAVSDIAKLVTNPSDFLTARAGSAVSLANQALTNKDYYGRQIYNPNDSLLAKAGKIGQTQLPIFANNILAATQGKESVPTAALNTAGLRVTTDPNAPSVLALTAQSNYAKTLDAKSAADYAALHPPTTDAAGNPIGSKDILSSPERSAIYLNHPEFLAFDTQNAIKAGGAQDPFYTSLSPAQQRLVLAAALKVPGQTNNYTKQLYGQSWYQPFLNVRDAFYASLPASKTPPAVVTPTINAATGAPLTSSEQAKAYNALALSQLGLPSAPSSSATSLPSGSLTAKVAKSSNLATGGVKLTKAGKSLKGGKLTVGHIGTGVSLKPAKPTALKSLTLKNVSGSAKLPKLPVPRVVRAKPPKLSNPLPGRSLRRSVRA